MADAAAPLPPWAEELRRRYLRGEATQFIVHGNVHDLVVHAGGLVPVNDFLARVLLARAKETVVRYDVSAGARFEKKRPGEAAALDEPLLGRSPEKVLPALERLLHAQRQVAVLLEYAETIAPSAEVGFSSEADRQSAVTLHRWSMSPAVERGDSVVVLLAENLAELHAKLVSNPRAAAIRIPMPDLDARREIVRLVVPGVEPGWADRLAEVTGGLKAVQLKAILEPATEGAEDRAERERLLRGLRAGDPGAERDEVLGLVARRKREIIERECAGLVEFVGAGPGLEAVGGMEEVKRDLRAVAAALREGRRERCPMGMLFAGPMGTGKTFVAEAFARESGLTALKLKNFRSKWVGATEANLERILAVIQAMGQVIVLVDEGDRALGGQEGEGDGGTSARVIARLKEFMCDGANRGRVLFLLMTNRPDKLDVDLKRAGRLDRKIPFFHPEAAPEVEAVLAAQVCRHGLAWTVEFPRDRDVISTPLAGYSAADLEAIVLLAAEQAGPEPVGPAHVGAAIRDYLPSRDAEMLEYMELVAVFEASNRRLLPARYAALTAEELERRLAPLRARVGSRR